MFVLKTLQQLKMALPGLESTIDNIRIDITWLSKNFLGPGAATSFASTAFETLIGTSIKTSIAPDMVALFAAEQGAAA